MAPGSSSRCRMAPLPDDSPPPRPRLPLIPTLIGFLATLNVASVVLALIG
jgi:hypothetical protein